MFGRGVPKPASPLCTDFPGALAALKRLHEAVLKFRRGPTGARARKAESHSLAAEEAVHTLPIDDHGASWLLEQLRPWWAQRGNTTKLPKGFDRNELVRLMTMSAFAPIDHGVQVIVPADRQRRAELSGEALGPAVGFQRLESYVDLLVLRKAFPSGFVAYPSFTRIKLLIGQWWAKRESAFGPDSELARGEADQVDAPGGVKVGCAGGDASEDEWSTPMSKDESARRILRRTNARWRDAAALVDKYGWEQVTERKVRVRLNQMDAATRARVENPGP